MASGIQKVYQQSLGPALDLGVPPLGLWLHVDKRIVIQVWDASDKVLIRQMAGPGVESGRGLFLVETISTTWSTSQQKALVKGWSGQPRGGPMTGLPGRVSP
jgi:hypothetical protein